MFASGLAPGGQSRWGTQSGTPRSGRPTGAAQEDGTVARKRKLDLKKYKARLQEVRDELREELQRIEDRTAGRDRLNSDTAGEDFDEPGGDAAQETLERTQAMALGDNLRDMLENVNNALDSIEKGTYGVCDSCGKDIPKARLDIMPSATMCTTCRERLSTR